MYVCVRCVYICVLFATFWLLAQQRFNLKRHLLVLIRGDSYSSRPSEVEGTAYCFDKRSQTNLSASVSSQTNRRNEQT